MFRFADVGKVWVPVTLPMGAPDDEVTIHLLLTLYTRKELRARERKAMTHMAEKIAARAREVKTPEDLQALFDETAAVEEGVVQDLLERTSGWRGVVDETGVEQEFSRERLACLLEYDWFFKAHRAALFETSRSGVAKNSKPGPGGLPARVQA